MNTSNIRVPLRDGEMGAYLAVPDRTPAGAVIAILLLGAPSSRISHTATGCEYFRPYAVKRS